MRFEAISPAGADALASAAAAPEAGLSPMRETGIPATQERAADLARMLGDALEDALSALGHRDPDYFLQLRAARKRDIARQRREKAASMGDRHRQLLAWRKEAIVQDLASHLSFEILQTARKYASFLESVSENRGATPRRTPPSRQVASGAD